MKPPFTRTSVPSLGVAPSDRAGLIKREEFLTVAEALNAPVPDGYVIQAVTDFDGAIVHPSPAPNQAEYHSPDGVR